jgi:hypothetical protein
MSLKHFAKHVINELMHKETMVLLSSVWAESLYSVSTRVLSVINEV